MPAVKTGMTPPPMPGMPAPMQPMGGMPPAQNPFAPMPPMPLAGMPPPPMPMPQGQPMPQTAQGQQMMGSTAGRRRRFGDALEGMLGRNQGIGAMPQQQRPMPPQMMPQQRMVAPGTPMMRTPSPRPMRNGGIVQYFENGGLSATEQNLVSKYGWTDAGNGMVRSPGGKLFDYEAGDTQVERYVSEIPVETRYDVSQTQYSPDDLLTAGSMVKLLQTQTASGEDRYKLVDDAGNLLSFSDIYSPSYSPEFAEKYSDYLGDSPKYGTSGMSYLDLEAAKNAIRNQGFLYGGQFTPEVAQAAVEAVAQENNVPVSSITVEAVEQENNVPVSSITGSESGPGTAVGADANFGTGVYESSNFPQSGPTDYANFRGNIGRTLSGYPEGKQTPEMGALFGPNVGFAQTVSQYYTDPVTGGLTTTFGPEMGAVSPIGGALLPARPVEIDIFDFLSTPTYGTMYSRDPYSLEPEEMAMGGEVAGPFGGSVPRNTMIGDQPHMLAYINPQEANLLKDLGGSGEPGPGGIPAYKMDDLGVGMSATGKSYSGSDKAVSGGFDAAAATADDDKPSSRDSIGPSGYTSLDAIAAASIAAQDRDSERGNVMTGAKDADLGVGGSDKTVTASDLSSGTGTTTYDTDDGGSVTVATGSSIDDALSGGSSVVDVISPPSVSTPLAPTYTDRFGNTYSSQAEADAADRAYAAQLASYGAGKVGFDRFKADAASAFPGRPREDTDRMAARAYPDFVEDYSRDINIFDEAPFTYTSIPGIGGGPAGGAGVGITPAPVIDSDPNTGQESGLFQSDADKALLDASSPVISLDAPISVDPDANDPRGNQIVSPTGTGIGRESDLQRGLGTPSTVQDVAPPEAGYNSLQDIKDRISRAEGTADEGGYGRLLGGQEGRFGVDLTNMTVQEVLDFQKARGPGSYAEYSQGVNEQRGMTRSDGSGVISTPAGKYQVVGSTLQSLVDLGIVDPNAKFDEGTQERIGTHLIMNDLAGGKGLSDLKSGKITQEEFETALGKQFEGIERGLDKGAGSTSTVIAAASEAGKQAEVDRRDENVEKIKAQIGDQAEPTGVEAFFYDVIGSLGLGLGKGLADDLRGKSREARQSIIDQHAYALANGATPKTDEEGNYIGFDISTMDTFADKVLGAEDISTFLPGGAEDADGDGVIDSERFAQIYDAQSTAANIDPYGMSTEQGFITSDGKEFFVDATGKVVEVTDENVPFEVGGGQTASSALGVSDERTDGGDEDTTTTDDTGHVDGVCNNPDYVYNPETDMCEPPAEEEGSDRPSLSINRPSSLRSFQDILGGVATPGPKIAPISANIRPMQGGGMAGLNRAADNFLKALAG